MVLKKVTRRAGWVLCLLAVSVSVMAAEAAPAASVFTVEAGRDSVDSRELYADLDLGLDNGLHLRAMYGRSRQEYNQESLLLSSRLLGISSDYAAPFVFGFDYQYGGSPEVLETRTKRFKLGTNTENWYLQLSYELRDTQLYTTDALTRQSGKLLRRLPDSYDVGSTGWGGNVSFYGAYPWVLSLAYMRYQYDRDLAALGSDPRWVSVFSVPTLGLATGLESWRRSADLSYNLGWGVVGVSGGQYESALDQSITTTGTLYTIWDLNAAWSLSLTVGQSGTDTGTDTITFSQAGLSYRW